MTGAPIIADLGSGRVEMGAGATADLWLRFYPASGPGWQATFSAHELLSIDISPGAVTFSYRATGEPLPTGPLVITARLSAGAECGGCPTVNLVLTAPADYPLDEFADPLICPLEAESSSPDWRFLVPDGEGLLLHGDGSGPGWRDRVAFHQLRITLPGAGLLHSAGAGLLVLAVGGHDHAVDLRPSRAEAPGLRLVNLATLGQWGYRREWRLVTLSDGGVIAAAHVLREHLRQQGMRLYSRSEKLAGSALSERQRRAVGGTVVWCHFDTLEGGLMDDLRAAGLRSVVVMGRPVDEAARTARDRAGFPGGPYFQTYDVFPPGSVTELGWRGTYPPEGSSDGWPDDLIRTQAGWLDPAWVYLPFRKGERFWQVQEVRAADGTCQPRWQAQHRQLPVQSYRRCPARHRAVIDTHADALLDREKASAVFYDIATAMWGLECYHPDHTADRRLDVGHRIDALDAMARSGRAVFSEAGKWWGIDHVAGFEGLLSYDQELNPDNVQLTDYPEDLRRRSFEFDLRHRVPLFGLVAREAVTRTLWWGTAQDRHAHTWAVKDAFAALYGANPIFVIDPEHALRPGTDRWRKFLATARAFDVLADLTRDARIVDHHTEGAQLGRTEFEGGATVEANVGFTTAGGLRPGEFVVRDGASRVAAAVRGSKPARPEPEPGATAR